MDVRSWSVWYLSTSDGTFAETRSPEAMERALEAYRQKHPKKVIEIVRRDFLEVMSEPTMIRRVLPAIPHMKRTRL